MERTKPDKRVSYFSVSSSSATAVSNVIQRALIPVVSRAQCQRHYPSVNITAAMLCAGEPGKGICQVSRC